MKLDNDLLRIMLMQIELDVDGNVNYDVRSYCKDMFPGIEPKQSVYHMKYLIDACFVQAENGYFRDLTPAGHAFLNNVRDNVVWAKTKEAVKPLGQVAISVVSEIAASVVRKMLELN
jgi:hypothetical protein